MKLIKFALILFLIPLLTSVTDHKFYVSITKVEYSEEENSLQIISKIFTDDMEEVLRERYNPDVSLGTEKEAEKDRMLLKKYVLQKLQFKVNGKDVELEYLGQEYENDIVKCYLEISGITKLESISVTNEILHDQFEEQQNIIHVKKDKKRRSLVLEKERPTGMLNFN